MVITIAETGPRLWPHGDKNVFYWLHYLAWVIHVPVFVSVAYLDAGSLFIPSTLATAIGTVLIVTGIGVALAAILQLGFETSTGVAGELYTGGLYSHSRNPQTVGIVVALAGAVLSSGSAYPAVLAAPDAVVLVLAVLAEEPWLTDEYGEEYEGYSETTPRFVW